MAITTSATPKIALFSTKGSDSNDELRIKILLSNFDFMVIPFSSSQKLKSCIYVIKFVFRERPKLLVMEGTGIYGGIACFVVSFFLQISYVFSSGDAIAPFLSSRYPFIKPFASFYEQLLCRYCVGFIGWTPYLVGRALTFGAKKGVTAAGWADFQRTPEELVESRAMLRSQLGISQGTIVFGILGSITWNKRVSYCYGWELIKALIKTQNKNIGVVIVGGGDGLSYLKNMVSNDLKQRVLIIGPVPPEKVPDYLSIMDVASLPQSLDGVGSFRYTTKISEYIAAKLPVVTGHIPMAYDLGDDWVWRLPGDAPWQENYTNAMTNLMDEINHGYVLQKKSLVPAELDLFIKQKQIERVTSFVGDILG